MSLTLTQSRRSLRARPSLRQTAALWRSRRALATLTDQQLEDIGLSRAQAETEAARPFWDAPQWWKC